MLERAAPFEHALAVNVLVATMTGRPWYWLSTRRAAPPRSGPVASHRFEVKTLSMTLTRPPRTNTAPPPPPSVVSPVLFPWVNPMCWIVSCGWSWSWQCEVVQTCAGSHVFMYRMRRWSAPLSVTLPPPSSTTTGDVLTTLAVAPMTMVTGSGPHEKVMIPPLATASTTACDVQLAGVPVPTTTSGWEVSTGAASGGRGPPPGFPGAAVTRLATALAVTGPSSVAMTSLAASAGLAVLAVDAPPPPGTTVVRATRATTSAVRTGIGAVSQA